MLSLFRFGAAIAAGSADPLAAIFDHPPAEARPQTFWHWMNGNVTANGITRDLEAMAQIGVGGVMIFDGSDYLPAGPANYLEPHWRELMTHAIREGNRLGIEVGMHNAPGWSSSGGPWVTPEMSMQKLVWTETNVAGGGHVALALTRPEATLGFYRDAFVIAFPALAAEAPRIADWQAKANFRYRVTGQLALPADVPIAATVDPAKVIDLTSRLQGDRIEWDAPAGDWTVMRIGHTSTGKNNVAASAAGRGLEIDKFSAAATEFHFHHVIDQVAADAKAAGLKGLSFVTIDSYEAGMQNWTADFPAEFRRRAGYDLTGYLPALFGRVVGNAGVSERFLFDFRRVQADLMAEHYYERMHQLARDRGLRFYVEGYGSGPFDELKVAGLADVPMTEFWTRTPWTPNRAVKMVTSAAHVYGKPVIGAEAFTGEFKTSRWLEYPYSLKILGDDMTAQGVNQFVFHSYVHQPHPDAAPGVSLGPYGFGFARTNTWFGQAKPWLDYLARTHALLRQGAFVADVLYFTGERSPDPSAFAMPVLPVGYTYDLVNTEVLLNRVTVRDGVYELPEGGRYRLLVLPPNLKAMRPELLRKLRDFVAAGGVLLGPKPIFSPTLAGFPASEAEMLRLADEIWAPERKGPGRVIPSGTIGEALAALGLTPDVTCDGRTPDTALSWQHRRLPDGDLYFVGNRQRRAEATYVSFRNMAGRQPEIWWPETGRKSDVAVFRDRHDRSIVPLRLEPGESAFVLFRRPAAAVARDLLKDGQPIYEPDGFARPAPSRNFTMSIWVKPDTDLRVMPKESTAGRIDETGKFYAIPADPGDQRFGTGHATAGLAVGRNGIFVVERGGDSCPAVLVAPMAVSGWTHVAVVYREGQPELWVNGALVKKGLVSGKEVHSGVGSPRPPEDYVLNFPAIESLARAVGEPLPASRGQVYFFEGNFYPAQDLDRALAAREIKAVAAAGVPAPEIPLATDLAKESGGISALIWQSGAYALVDGAPVQVAVSAPVAVRGPWRVGFQAGRGAPPSIELPVLRSLHLHEDPVVKYFAGTAAYARRLDVPAEFVAPDRRVILDLGRVEVLADVWLNGKRVGEVWKEPYRLDVTDAVHAGANDLEVRVTTLWPNRLIGDEQLPVENDYGLRDEQGNDPHGITKLPDWYREGKPKPPGGRIGFTTWRFYDKDEPLLASGLLGPVRLLNPVRVILKP
ncbi:MAG TPA: glycosyl hydrolase [Lacunisphaera sp.]|nr:glycosyl hydrolase [Lacunisphaera sp.]